MAYLRGGHGVDEHVGKVDCLSRDGQVNPGALGDIPSMEVQVQGGEVQALADTASARGVIPRDSSTFSAALRAWSARSSHHVCGLPSTTAPGGSTGDQAGWAP